MASGGEMVCCKCDKDKSVTWYPAGKCKGFYCDDCRPNGLEQVTETVIKEEDQKPSTTDFQFLIPNNPPCTRITRSYRTRQNPNALPRQLTPKGKGRRNIFKKNAPVKLQSARATFHTTNSVCHKGQMYTTGDVVSLRGVDGRPYFAQIRGFVVDPYNEKSVGLTWLLPTSQSINPEKCFDPLTFKLGPEDQCLRKMDFIELVMHATPDYFYEPTPFPSGVVDPRKAGFIWSRLRMKTVTPEYMQILLLGSGESLE